MLTARYGTFEMVEDNLVFTAAQKEAVNRILFEERKTPAFDVPVRRVGYEDGCKIYFEDDSFVSCRFSGTEPLLRIFAEARDEHTARAYVNRFREFLAMDS